MDEIHAGAGDDLLSASPGADILDGGDGNDWVAYDLYPTSGVMVDLSTGTSMDVPVPPSSPGSPPNMEQPDLARGDTLISIENVYGTVFADIIIGSSVANMLVGGEGDDMIAGLDADDIIIGGAGNDILSGGAGADVFMMSTIDFGAMPSMGGGMTRFQTSKSGSIRSILAG